VTVGINVSGRSNNPQISFSSTPGLPQDEIVSRILFGSSVTQISALQAVQLAASLNSLRGSGGGLNPLGRLRSATGISQLRILDADTATGRGTAVAAGIYISDKIYVEIITDAKGFTATQLEISLSRTSEPCSPSSARTAPTMRASATTAIIEAQAHAHAALRELRGGDVVHPGRKAEAR
jgi:translocation and assembly module TamB